MCLGFHVLIGHSLAHEAPWFGGWGKRSDMHGTSRISSTLLLLLRAAGYCSVVL